MSNSISTTSKITRKPSKLMTNAKPANGKPRKGRK